MILSSLCLQDSLHKAGTHLLPIYAEAGIPDALVTTLRKSESAYCVAMAASALGSIWTSKCGSGEKMVADAGAIRALIRVIKRAREPGVRETEGLYMMCAKTPLGIRVFAYGWFIERGFFLQAAPLVAWCQNACSVLNKLSSANNQ